MTAVKQLIYMIEKGQEITMEDKKRLLELEKLQLIQAYQLDPDLMKLRFNTPASWYQDTYGYKYQKA